MKTTGTRRQDYSRQIVAGLCTVAVLVLLGAIVLAASRSSVLAGLKHLFADRWGIVTLLDVYAGALVVAVWMRVCERRLLMWSLWVVALLCLGHIVSLIYLWVRASRSRTLPEMFAPANSWGEVRELCFQSKNVVAK